VVDILHMVEIVSLLEHSKGFDMSSRRIQHIRLPLHIPYSKAVVQVELHSCLWEEGQWEECNRQRLHILVDIRCKVSHIGDQASSNILAVVVAL